MKESTVVNGLICIVLTFIATLIMLSEWYYKENNIPPLVFRIVSIVVLILYSFAYWNISKSVTSSKRNRSRDSSTKFLLVLYFVFQTFFTLAIFLPLFFITIGFWE
jgi:phosphoglycerol transferase MdoB-like AlkP superfamily enzyme